MPKQIKLKTRKNDTSVNAYIKNAPSTLQADAKTLLQLFKDVTGSTAKMWGTSIVGFGEYTYHRSNGDEGTFMATGFSLRKSGPTLYIMPGYQDYSKILKDLGPHTLGKSCLYLKSLDGIHLPTLKKLIRAGLKDLKKNHEVRM